VAKRLKRPIRKNYYSPKRRAIYAKGEKIDHLALFEAHNWICYVCKEQIDRRLRHPNLMAATVEHILPLALGGKHVWANCAPSHAKCNFERGTQLDFQRAV
jgi:5-methylcytosine-specific restriction endonuclease McrA